MRKKPRFDRKAEVKKLARERVGQVRPARPIQPKTTVKPKHKKRVDDDTGET